MLKHCLLALLLAGFVYSVTATAVAQNGGSDQQAPGGPHGDHGRFDPEQRTQMLTKHLNLTSDQQAKVLDILKSAQSQAESLKSDSSVPEKERRGKMMQIHKNADDQIRALLDPDQQKKWDEMQARRGQGHHGDGQGPPGSSPQN
jgi:periplasmic protein CpxP/Spy